MAIETKQQIIQILPPKGTNFASKKPQDNILRRKGRLYSNNKIMLDLFLGAVYNTRSQELPVDGWPED